VQLAEHPSPPEVSPSSQASVPAAIPSPQVVSQVLGIAPVQDQPDSTVHEAEQPSPPEVSPSSQASVLALTPSPHIVVQVLGAVPEQ
jgi:hypothetical protein